MEAAQEVLQQLEKNRPEWVRNEVKLVSVAAVSGSIFGLVSLSSKLKEDGDPGLLAFAMAHALSSDFAARIMRGSAAWIEPVADKLDDWPEWMGAALALPLGAVGVGASVVGTTAEIGEFERDSIRKAVAWVHSAGFDARAGIRFFEEGFTAFRDHVEAKPTWKIKALRAALKPSELVLERIRKGPKAFLTNAERAEFVEEICVELGI